MRRIAILTAGGDTPALNATLYGAVQRASQLGIEVYGLIKGFSSLLHPQVPHVRLNPLYNAIPELDPARGGTILGASRTYVDPSQTEQIKAAVERLGRLNIDGLICIGGDGTINGMQPLSEHFPCVLAPKTIDNDLGLNYIDEPNEWQQVTDEETGKTVERHVRSRDQLDLDDMINVATPGYATAVFVAAQSIQRIRTTAESHRRIVIVELMGRDSGYITLGSCYGQPDMILIPEVPIDFDAVEQRVRQLYNLQKHVVIALGEGVRDATGQQLGAVNVSRDPAGNLQFAGAAESLKSILVERLGDSFFSGKNRHDSADSAIFTRKVGHTQRGGRPIYFDRFYAAQLGGRAVDLLLQNLNNHIATLQWSAKDGFHLSSIAANKLRNAFGIIHPRSVHPAFYDTRRFVPSRLGESYLHKIFTNALGSEDTYLMQVEMFNPGNLTTRYQSVNIDIQKRMEFLPE